MVFFQFSIMESVTRTTGAPTFLARYQRRSGTYPGRTMSSSAADLNFLSVRGNLL